MDPTTRTLEAIEVKLAEQFPREAVSVRKGPGGKELSYADQHFVLSRLIEIFGPMGVSHQTLHLSTVCEDFDEPSQKYKVGYKATVRLTCTTIDGMTCVKDGSGAGQGEDRSRFAAHEKALKEAETDATKRAARLLGNSMGLALYDKTQVGVGPVAGPEKAERFATGKEAAVEPLLERINAVSGMEELKALKNEILAFREDGAYSALVAAATKRHKELGG